MALRIEPIESLSRKPLPWDDTAHETLAPEYRTMAARVWIGRAFGEQQTSHSFAVITRALEATGASGEVLGVARRAMDDERRHAEICRRMASRYLGEEVPMPALQPLRVPAHEGASEELRNTLHIVGQCAINETTASAFLERCLEGATLPLARAVVRELMADEIDHARIGWAHLASAAQSEAARRAIAPWIIPMLSANLESWRAPRPLDTDETLVPHGCPPLVRIEAAVIDAMENLIVPGFQHVGFDVTAIRDWLATSVRPAH